MRNVILFTFDLDFPCEVNRKPEDASIAVESSEQWEIFLPNVRQCPLNSIPATFYE